MKMRVLMSGEYSEDKEQRLGGGYSLIIDMLDFMEQKHDIDFHFLAGVKKLKKPKKIEKNGITYHLFPKSRLPATIGNFTFDRNNIKKYIKQINPDIIHTHGVIHASTIIALEMNKPHILTVHGIVAKEKKSWRGIKGKLKGQIKIRYENKVFNQIKHIIAISKYVRDEIKKIYPESKAKFYVYNAGVSKEWLNHDISYDDGKHILFVGGIEERKGLIYLFKAIKLINRNKSNITLDIVGRVRNKTYYNELIDYINKNNLKDSIIFHQNVTDDELKTFYQNCTIFVLPSLEESLGIVTLEAMSYGKPVVLSNTSVNPTIVTHMKNGLLANYGDPEDFSGKIQLLLNSKKLRRKIGKEAKLRVNDYAMDKHCEKVYQLYKKLGKEGV